MDGWFGRRGSRWPVLSTTVMNERARLHSLMQQAEACRENGEYAEAESIYKQALVLAAQVCGPNELALAALFNNVGVLYKYMARFGEAGRFIIARC